MRNARVERVECSFSYGGVVVKNHKFLAKEFFVDPDITKAEGLPPEAFTSLEFLERELETIFKKHWHMVPPSVSTELANAPGAQVPFSLLDQPLFLQRDQEGVLHIYPNVCTHAAYPLVEKSGVVPRIVCGQHGRSFTLSGEVRDPKFASSKKFPRKCDHLKDLPLRELGQSLFVALNEPAVSFDDVFSPMRDSVAGLFPRGMKYARGLPHSSQVEGNWKQHVQNYLDSMHIPLIHQSPDGLVDALHFTSYQTELYDHSALLWGYAADPKLGFVPELLPARFHDPQHPRRNVFALWWFVFPNMTFNFYPWGLSVNVYMPVPGRPQKTLFHWYHYVADEKLYRLREELWHMEKVDKEDIEAIAATSPGLRSMFATRGLFAPGREAGPHWFHQQVSFAILHS